MFYYKIRGTIKTMNVLKALIEIYEIRGPSLNLLVLLHPYVKIEKDLTTLKRITLIIPVSIKWKKKSLRSKVQIK